MDSISRRVKLTEKGIEQVEQAIERSNCSQDRLAKLSSCTQSTLSRFLQGGVVSEHLSSKVLSVLKFDRKAQNSLVEVDSHRTHFLSLPSAQVALERENAVEALSETTPDDVQAIASVQIKILGSYHQEVLLQAKQSFRVALTASVAGFVFFISAIGFVLKEDLKSYTAVPLSGGALVEVVAGINFYLYAKANAQLDSFHSKLDQTQRFLLANSICESIEGELMHKTRSELVKTVSFIEKSSSD